MKKSKLRNIIRESIKELITEQAGDTVLPSNCLRIGFRTACPNQGSSFYQNLHTMGYPGNSATTFSDNMGPGGQFSGQDVCYTINGQPITSTNYQQYAGQLFTLDPSYAAAAGILGATIPGANYYTGACDVFEMFANAGNLASYNMTVELIPASCGQGGCGSSTGQQVSGCTDSNAYNFDLNATLDDGSCDYGFYCRKLGNHPKFGTKCTPANQSNPGPFATLQDCLNSGCEFKNPNKGKTITEPAGPSITPFTTDPRFKMIDPKIDRMQDLANIKKER